MRIGFALIILTDVAHALYYLHFFYTEQGFLPLSALVTFVPPPGICLFLLSRWWIFAAVLISLLGVAAAALLVGYQTRLATVACWLLLFGLHQRNPYVLYGGDSWLLQSIFWCIFLPWGASWSVDEADETAPGGPAAVGLIFQTALIYFLSGWGKLNPSWLDGSAISRFLQADELRGAFGRQLLYYPELLNNITRLLPWVEMVAAVAILLPFWSGRIRALALGGFAIFHLALVPAVQLRTFSWVGLCVVLGLMPSIVWRQPLPNPSENRDGWPKWQWLLLLLPLNLVVLNLGIPVGELPARLSLAAGQRYNWALFAEPPTFMSALEIELELENGQVLPLDCRGKARLESFSWENAYPDLRFRQYGQSLVRSPDLKLLTAFAAGLSRKLHRQNWESPPKRLHLYRRQYVLPGDFKEPPPKRDLILDYQVPDASSYIPPEAPLPPAGG